MRIFNLALLAIVAASPMLGGCQSIFGRHQSLRTEISIPEQDDPAEYAASQMAAGRTALGDRQFGLAIIAFRNARLAPEHTAAASNGLAIAYAQIGRPDLAERYFKQAIAEAPSDKRYQGNLAHFYASVQDSRVQMAQTEAAEGARYASQSVTQVLPGTAERSAVRIERPAQQIVRISAKEVGIGMQTDSRRRVLESQNTAHKPVRRVNPAYPIRIEFGKSDPPARIEQPTRQYPIRIELGKNDPSVRAKQPARQYPIRVSLAPSD